MILRKFKFQFQKLDLIYGNDLIKTAEWSAERRENGENMLGEGNLMSIESRSVDVCETMAAAVLLKETLSSHNYCLILLKREVE
jgi:hypothetical protein